MASSGLCWAINVLGNVNHTPRLLVVCGTNGIGKTKLLRGLNRFLKNYRLDAWASGWWGKNPPELKYASWMLWANLDAARSEDERMQFSELIEADILLLDDIGAEVDRYKSGLALSNLTWLLSMREFKWTAVTMNYLPEQWVGTESAPGRFGKRVGDRLFRNSAIVAMRQTSSWALRKGGA